jgi:hypothetical protein
MIELGGNETALGGGKEWDMKISPVSPSVAVGGLGQLGLMVRIPAQSDHSFLTIPITGSCRNPITDS